MSRTHAASTAARAVRPPRVREQAREALAVMALSAGISAALALALVLLMALGG